MKKLRRFYYCHLENKNLEKLVMVAGEKDVRNVAHTLQECTNMYQIGTILFNIIEFLSEHLEELQGVTSKAVIDRMVAAHVEKYSIGHYPDVYVECLESMLYSLPKDYKVRNVFFDRIKNYFSFVEVCSRKKENCTLNRLLLFNSKFGELFKTGEKSISYAGLKTEYSVMDRKEMSSFLRNYDETKKDYDLQHKKYIETLKSVGLDEFLEQNNDVNILTYYKIDTIVDLIAIPLQAILTSNNTIALCQECNRYHVPVNKRNTKFCNNPDRTDSKNRTCKQVRANYRNTKVYSKDKTITHNYILVKRRLQNRVESVGKNVSEDGKILRKNQYDEFMEKSSEYVDKIKKHECTKEEYVIWLKTQKKLTEKLPK